MEQSPLDNRIGRVGQVDKVTENFSRAIGMMHKPLSHSQSEKTYKEKEESDIYRT